MLHSAIQQTIDTCNAYAKDKRIVVPGDPEFFIGDMVENFFLNLTQELVSDTITSDSIENGLEITDSLLKSEQPLLYLEEFVESRIKDTEVASGIIDIVSSDFSKIADRLQKNTVCCAEESLDLPKLKLTEEELIYNMNDWRWRVRHLYKIVSKEGKVVPFRPNSVQNYLIDNIHSRNWVLKSRRHGASTLFAIIILDQVLFQPNKNAAIIAHGLREVRHLFKTKILFPFQTLPQAIKESRLSVSKSANELSFDNGSSFYVTVSTRSGTLHYVLISELGIIYWNSPTKAEEIISGTLESVDKGQFAVVESTPYGMTGYRDKTVAVQKQYEKNVEDGAKLDPIQYRFFFLPWFEDPGNKVNNIVSLEPKELEYFNKLELQGVTLTPQQKSWYVLKKRTLGDIIMWREHPSTVEESFRGSVEGAFFTDEVSKIYSDGRITTNLYNPDLPVWIGWDLGLGDMMVLIFFHVVNGKRLAFHCYANSGPNLEHYIRYIEKSKYGFDDMTTLVFPHDIKVREQTLDTGETRLRRVKTLNITLRDGRKRNVGDLKILRAKRAKAKIEDIDLIRDDIGSWYFDSSDVNQSNNETGIVALLRALSSYGREFNKETQTYSNTPKHDKHSHYVDAFIVAIKGITSKVYTSKDLPLH